MDTVKSFLLSPAAVYLALGWLFFIAFGLHTKLWTAVWRRIGTKAEESSDVQAPDGPRPVFIKTRGPVSRLKIIGNRIRGHADFLHADVGLKDSEIRSNTMNTNQANAPLLEDIVRHFDRLFKVELNTIDFRHLWNDAGTQGNSEPYLLIQLVVHNNTPLHIAVTGLTGQATIDGDLCALPAKWQVTGEIDLSKWAYQTHTVQQNLLTEKGRELLHKIENREVIRFSLGTVNLLVEDKDGVIPNRPIAVPVSFDIDPVGLDVGHPRPSKRPLMLTL